MPYINPQNRRHLDDGYRPIMVNELTYVLFKTVKDYMADTQHDFKHMAEVVAALEQAKDEFQRTVIHPYEDKKREENGDV